MQRNRRRVTAHQVRGSRGRGIQVTSGGRRSYVYRGSS